VRALRAPALLLFLLLSLAPAAAQTPAHLTLYADGSLRDAFAEIAAAFTQQTGIGVDQTYGATPELRERIEHGASADIFAAADTINPRYLQVAGTAGEVTVFAHNRLCLLVKPLQAGTHSAGDIMLDNGVRLITAIPGRDSAGDLAEATFRKIENIRPGSLTGLDAKALRVFGSSAIVIPAGTDPAAYLLLVSNEGDALLNWCTATTITGAANPNKLESIEISAPLSIKANYGLVVRNGAPPAATALRDFILSPAGQKILERDGFDGV
jgi:ABC-type molybdate transport system substrate-binding protein